MRLLVVALIGAVALFGGAPVIAQPAVGAAEMIGSILATGRHRNQHWPLLSDVMPVLRALYAGSGGAPLWSRDGVPTPSSALVVQQLVRLESRGLAPSDYDAPRLQVLVDSTRLSATAIAEFDISLTVNAIRALRALQFGRVSASAAHAELRFIHEPYDVTSAIREMTTATNSARLFDDAEPPFLHYRLLKAAMARYRALANDSALSRIVVRGTLRPGGRDAGVPQIRRMLLAVGDLPAAVAAGAITDSLAYDSTLVSGVRRFQRRHGFASDGVVGGGTLARLRQPFPARIAQMELTLERWRWLPHTLSDPAPIVVNIPAFRLHAFTKNDDREADLMNMDVVVGRAYRHRTPVFSSTMRYLIFSPYWDVPPGITRKEILPKAHRDPGFLAREHYEIVSSAGALLGTSAAAVAAVDAGRARIRQKPGAKNSLGGVKFIFPNEHDVYLHDTPAQSLFSRARRDFSHGCIRISQPARLAEFLLRDQAGWDSTTIVAAMRLPMPRNVTLTRPVPVHVVYATAGAREDGVVLFFDDIYGYDRSLAALLAKGYPYPGGRR